VDHKIATVVTDANGDHVVIREAELKHAMTEHFSMLPRDMLLELIERILKDPTRIFIEEKAHRYYLFYRLDNQKYRKSSLISAQSKISIGFPILPAENVLYSRIIACSSDSFRKSYREK